MKKGFTLIELVMVIVILGILAATALPRFIDLSTKANENAAKAALGNIRAAVAIGYANIAVGNVLNKTPGTYPDTITADMFADGVIPKETLSSSSGSNAVVVGTGTAEPTGTTGGWFYNSSNGRVYINDTTGGRSTW